MKLILLFLFVSLSLHSQVGDVVLKVYLEDAETGKNICDARVILEGYEIKGITGKYDKKGKYYYFTEIPKSYNTVMVYHKKYNEKGFQNIEGLPKELRLKLYNPLNVSYSFLKVPDSIYNDKKKKNIKNLIYKNFYVEDPYKIAVNTNENLNYEELKEFFNKLIKESNLEIELVNPSWERDRIDDSPYNTLQKGSYPKIVNTNESEELTGEYVFPLLSGVNNIQTLFDSNYSKKLKDICFIFRKKNGSKFKRFNDPIIKSLKEKKLIIYSVILNKKNGYASSKLFSKYDFKTRDKLNKKFNITHSIDSSKVFFYDNNIFKIRKSSKFLKKQQPYLQFDEPIQGKKEPSFILINNDDTDIPKYFPYQKNEYDVQKKTPIPERSIGLGILDMYEYYFKAN